MLKKRHCKERSVLRAVTRAGPVLALALLVSTSAVRAQEPDWTVRLYGFFMATGDAPRVTSDAGTLLTSDNTDGAGAGVSAEYRLSSRFGIELSAWVADHGDFRATPASGVAVDATDTMTNSSLGAALNYHLTPGSTADLHVGLVVARIAYDDLTLTERSSTGMTTVTRASIDADLALGLHVGLDLALPNSKWILYADLRYMASTIDGETSGGMMSPVDYDPLLVGLGFGYRF